ncbi:hypothetical protein VKT23_015640 [Stygiomarasmius scandens]|uniref:ZZ-type domain-containing protein n=1 Tax=Marasmiellus scandens TaxID=2682957 RepID=A0ABR1IZQ2_9AGAR
MISNAYRISTIPLQLPLLPSDSAEASLSARVQERGRSPIPESRQTTRSGVRAGRSVRFTFDDQSTSDTDNDSDARSRMEDPRNSTDIEDGNEDHFMTVERENIQDETRCICCDCSVVGADFRWVCVLCTDLSSEHLVHICERCEPVRRPQKQQHYFSHTINHPLVRIAANRPASFAKTSRTYSSAWTSHDDSSYAESDNSEESKVHDSRQPSEVKEGLREELSMSMHPNRQWPRSDIVIVVLLILLLLERLPSSLSRLFA